MNAWAQCKEDNPARDIVVEPLLANVVFREKNSF